MQTKVQAPARQSRESQGDRSPAQLAAGLEAMFVDHRHHTAQFKATQANMAASLQQQNLKALQAKVKASASVYQFHAQQLNANGFSLPNAIPLVQRVPKVVGVPRYVPGYAGMAGKSELDVELDGTIHPASANSPQENPLGFRELREAGKAGDYRLHLVNGRLGGEGKIPNLAWGTPAHNRAHVKNFETHMQEDARNPLNAGKEMNISVSVSYFPDDPSIPWKRFFAEKFECDYKVPTGHVSFVGPITIREAFSESLEEAEYTEVGFQNMHREEVEFLRPGEIDSSMINKKDILPPGTKRVSNKGLGGVSRAKNLYPRGILPPTGL